MSDTLTIPNKVTLAMASKAPRKNNTRNSRKQYVGRIADGAVRAKVYTDSKLSTVTLKVKDAETKALDHGEQRLTWNDEDAGVLAIAFIPLAERGNVKKFKLDF